MEVCTGSHELVVLGLVRRVFRGAGALHQLYFRLEMADDALDERIQFGPDGGAIAGADVIVCGAGKPSKRSVCVGNAMGTRAS
jgi:hypothetical protein